MKIIYRSPKNVLKHWIAALRLGKYSQTKFQLKNPETNSFCCLGVLCDLAEKDGGDSFSSSGRYKNNTAVLPNVFKKYLKLKNFEVDFLMQKNDTGESFENIAEYIEKYILPNYKEKA